MTRNKTPSKDTPPPSGSCLACQTGRPLPGIVGCPNPACYKHPGPRLYIKRARPKGGGGNRPAVVAYHPRQSDAPRPGGWEWQRG